MALAVCLIAAFVSHDVQAKKPTITISGTVKTAEMYRGKVVSVSIKDVAQGEFLVARSTEIGQELLRHVGAKVKATGYVKKPRPGSDFANIIDVLSYEIDAPGEPPAPRSATHR